MRRSRLTTSHEAEKFSNERTTTGAEPVFGGNVIDNLIERHHSIFLPPLEYDIQKKQRAIRPRLVLLVASILTGKILVEMTFRVHARSPGPTFLFAETAGLV